MPEIARRGRIPFRLLAIAISAGLFGYLIWRVGPRQLWGNLGALGWGFLTVLALTGISHFAKTWAWRLTLVGNKDKISFWRMLGLRLGAESAGQLGIFGQTLGDSIRVSGMGKEIPLANGLASVTLDRGLYFVSGVVVTIAGILTALPVLSFSHSLRRYAVVFIGVLITFLLSLLLAVRKRWPVLSGGARIIARVPSLKNWIDKRYQTIHRVENTLLDFHHNTPRLFWASFALNLGSHCLAVLEVCLVLWLMSVNLGFFKALVIEALTKLVNVLGSINPGNLGTFEGGNVLIGKLFGMGAATGLALGLSRRLRSLVWTAIGAIWLMLLTRPRKNRKSESGEDTSVIVADDTKVQPGAVSLSSVSSAGAVAFAILLANGETSSSQLRSSIARVGSLPILLRTILAARKLGAARIMVVIDRMAKRNVQRDLLWTGRLPESVQWIEAGAGDSLSQVLKLIANLMGRERLVLIDGNTTYHPSLLRKASEWKGEGSALALTSAEKLVWIHALPIGMIRDYIERCAAPIATLGEFYASLSEMHSVVCMEIPEDFSQNVTTAEGRDNADKKLDRWLVKPTDGIYARMNRKISIPISRQLIKFPITPNMVSIFTLGVGFASAACFAYGSYWNTLLGAFLCICASILDGCDGEVARLKLQESDFGCWLETVCDYLFYLFLFVGMTIGLWRTSGNKAYLEWGGLLVFGAVATFLAAGWQRHRLAAGRPEQLLGIWQAHAESRPSNPFLYVGRQLEFIIRRCFFPYALLVFALFNITNVAFVLAAIGANLAWPIILYSSLTFSGAQKPAVTTPAVTV